MLKEEVEEEDIAEIVSKWTGIPVARMLEGELEKLGTPKGLPNPVKLFNDILELGGEIVFCELALENKDIKPEDLRDPRIKIKKAPPFLMDVEGASQTYVF